eukprot:4908386-Pyramimonas_sp.AAC.1
MVTSLSLLGRVWDPGDTRISYGNSGAKKLTLPLQNSGRNPNAPKKSDARGLDPEKRDAKKIK